MYTDMADDAPEVESWQMRVRRGPSMGNSANDSVWKKRVLRKVEK